MYIYDEVRDKFLSVPREYVESSIKSRTVTNQFLRIGKSPMRPIGHDIIRNGTIVGIAINTETAKTWSLEIYRKNSAIAIGSIAVSSDRLEDTSLNIDVDSGWIIQLKVAGTNIQFPTVLLEIAWRK